MTIEEFSKAIDALLQKFNLTADLNNEQFLSFYNRLLGELVIRQILNSLLVIIINAVILRIGIELLKLGRGEVDKDYIIKFIKEIYKAFIEVNSEKLNKEVKNIIKLVIAAVILIVTIVNIISELFIIINSCTVPEQLLMDFITKYVNMN